MLDGQLVFSQLMDFLPRREFNACVDKYRGNRRSRGFSCRDQFLCMAFAQLTYRESLRDIETCLRALQPKLYHAGFRGMVSRSTLADANAARDWRIYADFAQVLIAVRGSCTFTTTRRRVRANGLRLRFHDHRLCLSLFPWAKFRRRKGAVKLHTLIDLRGNIPCFIHFSTGKVHDVNALDHLPIEPGAFYMMDRGYVDFERLYRFTVGWRSSSPAANGISTARAVLVDRSTRPRDCAAIRPSSWRVSSRRGRIPSRCAALRSTTPSTNDGWCS